MHQNQLSQLPKQHLQQLLINKRLVILLLILQKTGSRMTMMMMLMMKKKMHLVSSIGLRCKANNKVIVMILRASKNLSKKKQLKFRCLKKIKVAISQRQMTIIWKWRQKNRRISHSKSLIIPNYKQHHHQVSNHLNQS